MEKQLLREDAICGWEFYIDNGNGEYIAEKKCVFDCPLYFDEVLKHFMQTFDVARAYAMENGAEERYFIECDVAIGEPYSTGTKYEPTRVSRIWGQKQFENIHGYVREHAIGLFVKDIVSAFDEYIEYENNKNEEEEK